MKYDVKKAIQIYFPSFLELLGEQNISWTSIDKGLEAHLQKIKDKLEDTPNGIWKEATFFTIMINHSLENGKGKGMFDFYDKIFKSLLLVLSKKEKEPIHRMLSKVLTNLDKNYLNFIGELATLNKLMLTGEYELLNIEEPIHPDRNITADIFMRRKNDRTEILIEVLNLHLEDREFNDYITLQNHLRSKFVKKMSDKLITSNNVLIQPVIWTSTLEQIQQLSDLYTINNFQIDNVAVPLTYLTFVDSNGVYEHRFESVRTILN
jgi:hypothetical protein